MCCDKDKDKCVKPEDPKDTPGQCTKPENLKGKPGECTPEQVAECHDDTKDHPCEEEADEKE